MRYTPFLDEIGVRFKPDVPDHAVNIIDNCLDRLDREIDWGEWEGRKRKRCPEQPMLLTGMPLGQYHCPVCGMMIVAAIPHLPPGVTDEQRNHPLYPMLDYEAEYGRPWPPGYEEPSQPSAGEHD